MGRDALPGAGRGRQQLITLLNTFAPVIRVPRSVIPCR